MAVSRHSAFLTATINISAVHYLVWPELRPETVMAFSSLDEVIHHAIIHRDVTWKSQRERSQTCWLVAERLESPFEAPSAYRRRVHIYLQIRVSVGQRMHLARSEEAAVCRTSALDHLAWYGEFCLLPENEKELIPKRDGWNLAVPVGFCTKRVGWCGS